MKKNLCLVLALLSMLSAVSCGNAASENADGGAEVFFPNLDKDENFLCVYESETIEDNGYTIRFTTYKNNVVKPL